MKVKNDALRESERARSCKPQPALINRERDFAMTEAILSDPIILNKARRKPLSKKTRFEIFKRDCFQCQYCGAHPPDVVLEVDHVDPVALGGTDHKENLVTSCYACNRGKSATPLTNDDAKINHHEMASTIKERSAQLKAYLDAAAELEALQHATVWAVFEAMDIDDSVPKDCFGSVSRFLTRIELAELINAAKVALRA